MRLASYYRLLRKLAGLVWMKNSSMVLRVRGRGVEYVIDQFQDVNQVFPRKDLSNSSPRRVVSINEGPVVKLHYVTGNAGQNECGGLLYDMLRVCLRDVRTEECGVISHKVKGPFKKGSLMIKVGSEGTAKSF